MVGPCEASSVPEERFGSLSSAVTAGLELATSSGPRTETCGTTAWHFEEGEAAQDPREVDSLSAALDAALEAAFDEEGGSLCVDEGALAASG